MTSSPLLHEHSDSEDSSLSFADSLTGDFLDTHSIDESLTGCSYCGIDNNSSVVQCVACDKWFCNSKQHTKSSHIVNHLVLARHNCVALHPQSDLGNATLECYNCGCKNIFVLGFVSAKSEAVVVILCRVPCAQQKNINWDTDQWQPLIADKQLLSWVAPEPSPDELMAAKLITPSQIVKLETKWRSDKNATIEDVEEHVEAAPVLLRYTDAFQYQRTFGPLVKLESDSDKQLKESQALDRINVNWGSANGKHLASFVLNGYENSSLKVATGDEMVLKFDSLTGDIWEGHGYIIKLPNSQNEEFTLELVPSKEQPPLGFTNGFTAEFVWKGTSYDRQQQAMKTFAVNKKSVSGYLYYKLLGHEVDEMTFDIKLPKTMSIPSFAELNVSQVNAVKAALVRPLTLIQGPPGTGKTVTSATIVYHLSKLHKEQILVCAPSNVAVDHLASKLESLGLKVVKLTARSKEDIGSSVEHLSLHNLIAKKAKGPLKKLLHQRERTGELSTKQMGSYLKLMRSIERSILSSADVVCCTCVGAGDKRLKGMSFKSVLIDESAQASEPESLIPIVRGAKQVILVGDHQQLGPVIMDRKAGDAGLRQSLFERMILLGHMPIRLEVQYRMNPHISEFPSNMFYEGSLQNGVTKEQRSLRGTFPWPIFNIPMMFWAMYSREELSASSTSYLNRIEAVNCERVITRLFKDGVKPEDIGVITPYEGQRAYLVSYMQMNGSMDKSLYDGVEIASVDAFQGREKDYILLSCVRSNEAQEIGFLRDPRRLNVALTRARYGLCILGNPRSLCRNTLWNRLLVHFRENGCLVEGSLENLQLSTVQLSARNDD